MTTINDIEDLVRILRERPEWLNAVRELVLSEELLRLPETVAQLSQTVQEFAQETREQLKALNERMDRFESTQAEMKAEQAEMKAEQVEMKTELAEMKAVQVEMKAEQAEMKAVQVEMKAELAEMKTEQAEMKAVQVEMKAELAEMKTEQAEMKAVQVEMKAVQVEMKAEQVEMKAEQAEMRSDLSETNRRLSRLENQVNDIRGSNFEITAAKRIFPAVYQRMNLYDCVTVIGPGIPLAQERINDIRNAARDGSVPRDAAQEVALTDIVLHGRRDEDDQPIWVAIEASVRIDEHDITRARQRADILSAVYRAPALAAVVGESIDDRDRVRAQRSDVVVVTLRPR